MANSRHAHLRYNILDYCFRNKAFTFEQLLKYLNDRIADIYPGEGIAERSLRADLKVFRDKENGFGAPLPKHIQVHRYSDPNFSIAQRPLLKYEQYLIDTSQQLLERFENHPKYDKLSEALIKFQDDKDQDTDTSKILFYDHNEEYKGIKYLKPLYLAIKKKQVLRITFKGFKDESSKSYEFHPSVLKQYNRRWFVYGVNADRNIKQWSIPLDDRLIDYQILKDICYVESDADWASFFRPMIGIVRPENAKVEMVVLRFYNDREHYFKTKPFQPDFDEFFEPEKKDQVWFKAIINKELVQQLLSYGGDVEVLSPASLKLKMKLHSEAMSQYYV